MDNQGKSNDIESELQTISMYEEFRTSSQIMNILFHIWKINATCYEQLSQMW